MSRPSARKKRRVRIAKEAPFPIPIQSITGVAANNKVWSYYTGFLHGHIIAVKHIGDMDCLYKMGFFGKGNLSRSQPEYNSKYKYATITSTDGHTESYPRIVNKQWYESHLKWAGLKTEDTSSDEESQQIEDDNNTMKATQNILSHDKNQNNENVTAVNQTDKLDSDDVNIWNISDEDTSVQLKDKWETKPLDSEDVWDNTEPDSNFWDCDHGNKQTPKTDPWDSVVDENFWDCDVKNNKTLSSTLSKGSQSGSALSGSAPSENVMNESVTSGNPCASDHNVRKDNVCDNSRKDNGTDHCESLSKKLKLDVTSNNCDQIQPHSKHKTDATSFSFHPLCQNDDQNGDLFVIPNKTFVENERQTKNKWKPVVKQDPYALKEYLQLSFVEAFFLSYGLGCFILKYNEKVLNLCEMWKIFCEKQKNFIPAYITYHYFRSKGWVPKSGLKFGCDFILYKVGPAFYHGSYSVIIQYVSGDSLTPVLDFSQRNLSWRSLFALNRITEHVAKEVMICYVVKPDDITEEQLKSPACIKQFKVKEVLLTRWISSQERQKKESEIFP